MKGKSLKPEDPADKTTAPERIPGPALYVVSTPIGNLGDFSPRAIDTLRRVDLVLAEDTRSFGLLKKRFEIDTPAVSCFEHNEQSRLYAVLRKLEEKASIALVSEAGTPTISDPGYRVVRECRKHGYPVTPVPGACAAIAALAVSGFETDRFYFAGFLPTKDGKRRSSFKNALALGVTVIFYESPFRIIKSLEALDELGFTGEVFIAREITKLHEECLLGSPRQLASTLKLRQSIKGEIVLLVRGRDAAVNPEDTTSED